MKEAKDVTACVIDHGLFIELAVRLSREFKRVLYWSPWECGFPHVENCVLGDGYPQIDYCNDFWPFKGEIDLFVFPDSWHSGLQLELESQGFPVWGSRTGDRLELFREKFKKLQMELGMEVPEHWVVKGLDKLRTFLWDKEHLFVKISKLRGTMDTWEWKNKKESAYQLDLLAVKFGPMKNIVPFLIESPIDTPIELGCDNICIDGHFLSPAVHGYEKKDEVFVAAVQEYSTMPEPLLEVNAALAPILKERRYRNNFSTEIRVKDGKAYLIDPCCRCPSPAVESQYELWANYGEIVWAGAHGEIVNPNPIAKFAVECTLSHTKSKENWRELTVPESARRWIKLYYAVQTSEDTYGFPPLSDFEEYVGAVVGVGDTLEEAIDAMHKNKECLDGQPVNVETRGLIDLISEIEQAEEEGIKFPGGKLPEPASVLEEK